MVILQIHLYHGGVLAFLPYLLIYIFIHRFLILWVIFILQVISIFILLSCSNCPRHGAQATLVMKGDFKVENKFSVEYYEQHGKSFELGSGCFLLIFLILIYVFLFFHHFSVPPPATLNNYLLFKFSAKNLVPSQCPPYVLHRLYWIYFFKAAIGHQMLSS